MMAFSYLKFTVRFLTCRNWCSF